MRWFFFSVALSIKAAVSLLDSDELPITDLSYNTPDMQISAIDTSLLKIYYPGSDLPVNFLGAISTDFEVVPAEIASDGNLCLSRRYATEKEGRIEKRGSCQAPSPTAKEPATQEPPTDGRGYPRPVHTPEILDPDVPDPVTKPARKPQQKPSGPVPLHPPINKFYDNPFISDISGRIKVCASRLMTLCCWGPIIKSITTQINIDNCQSFEFMFSDGLCEDPGRYVCCSSIDTSYLARFEPNDAPKTGIDCKILFPDLGWFDQSDLDQNPDVIWRNTRPLF